MEDIFPSGVEERAVHVHLLSRGRSSATLVVASATWPGTVSGRGNTRGGFRGWPRGGYRRAQRGSHQSQGGCVHVNLCSAAGPLPGKYTRDMGVQADDSGLVTFVVPGKWEFSDFPSVSNVGSEKTVPAVQIYTLRYVNVNVSGCVCCA